MSFKTQIRNIFRAHHSCFTAPIWARGFSLPTTGTGCFRVNRSIEEQERRVKEAAGPLEKNNALCYPASSMKTGGRTKLRHNGVIPSGTARTAAITHAARPDIFSAPPPAGVFSSQLSVVSVLIRNNLPNQDITLHSHIPNARLATDNRKLTTLLSIQHTNTAPTRANSYINSQGDFPSLTAGTYPLKETKPLPMRAAGRARTGRFSTVHSPLLTAH
jgi:hypothetical protein